MFQKDLGTLLDKSNRTEALVQPLAAAMGLETAAPTALAAAHLAKADLATATVMEMTALAGTMGRHYALKQGLDPAVAEAIFEAALPRSAGDLLPKSEAGIIVAVADRLDSLVGLVTAVGAPTGGADPYALRRAAYGMLQVRKGLRSCAEVIHGKGKTELQTSARFDRHGPLSRHALKEVRSPVECKFAFFFSKMSPKLTLPAT
jgi:glycyl-tRNA synthetase beta subunit